MGFGRQSGRPFWKPGLRVAANGPTRFSRGPDPLGSGFGTDVPSNGSGCMPYQTVFHGEIAVMPAYRKPSIWARTVSACADQNPSRSA